MAMRYLHTPILLDDKEVIIVTMDPVTHRIDRHPCHSTEEWEEVMPRLAGKFVTCKVGMFEEKLCGVIEFEGGAKLHVGKVSLPKLEVANGRPRSLRPALA